MFLSCVVGWAFFREWEWPQTVFIVLHCLVLLMKQHSYASYTGWLSNEYLRKERLRIELQNLQSQTIENTDLTRAISLAEEKERLILEIENTQRDLTGKFVGKIKYPENLTYSNFLDYMFCPTLVYELEYPRTDRYHPFNCWLAWTVLIAESGGRISWKNQSPHWDRLDL